MARILAIDFGMKRTGIAVTDPMQIIATSLTTVETHLLKNFLEDYCKKESVESIVIGLPLFLTGGDMDITAHVRGLAKQLEKLFPDKKIVLWDERYTSKMASQTLIAAGKKRKDRQDKGLVDRVSATILLQNYLQFTQQ